MTGKRALERLRKDPELVARAPGYAAHRVADGVLQHNPGYGTTWLESRRSLEELPTAWTLFRRRRPKPERPERNVFQSPRVAIGKEAAAAIAARDEILRGVSEVYLHITDGTVGKVETDPIHVKALHDDAVTKLVEQGVAQRDKEIAGLRKALTAIKHDCPHECTCHEAYTCRQMTDPSCAYHDYGRDFIGIVNAALSQKDGV